jgi:cell wall-associated NlpC family hydrolase
MKSTVVVLSISLFALVVATPLVTTLVATVALAEASPVGGPPATPANRTPANLTPPNPTRAGPTPASPPAINGETSTAAGIAVEYALAQIGTPYRWGAESPGVGFDCSGLVQAAWAAAGVHLPRVAQDEFDAGPLLAPGAPLMPGDLVFFGPEGGGVTHVGLVVDPSGEMVDAPHTGAFVRLESFPVAVGARWGGDVYVGATRPGGD